MRTVGGDFRYANLSYRTVGVGALDDPFLS